MEVTLVGTEVHVLREILEGVIAKHTREIDVTMTPETVAVLKEKVLVFKSILEKFPVELTAV